ncbi:hypothetical protein [Nocardiopsis trehalosi]|uniref:hypothetical protein n=1 Tax=Nocardiopsis trehalosi TaxID=109329 RepID=UPI00082C7574|nr:hypothetical protein [Nocardiopsis trehalosi]
MTTPTTSPGGQAPDSRVGAALRFATELIAWIAAPWALSAVSIPLAVLAAAVLIGVPTLFATPGDKANIVIPVPGWVTVAHNIGLFAVAGVAPFFVWPAPVALAAALLAAAGTASQAARWRWLATARLPAVKEV